MKKLFVGIALLVSTAHAQDVPKNLQATGMMTLTPQNYPSPTFQMDFGACLRGPMTFLEPSGAQMFHLDAGVDFPTGCSKK